jgi:uncharacterized protein
MVGPAHAADYPRPDGYVLDVAGVIGADVEKRMEVELADYARRTTNQVAVAVISSLDGQPIEDYAHGLFNEWGIGTAAKDNGVLLLLAIDDRADRIQVGLGLESVLTDTAAKAILDDVVEPLAADGNFDGGLLRGERAIRAALHDPNAGVQVAVPGPRANPFGGGTAQDPYQDATTGGAVDTSTSGGVDSYTSGGFNGIPGGGGPPGYGPSGDSGFPLGFVFLGVIASVIGIIAKVVTGSAGSGSGTGSGFLFGAGTSRRGGLWSSNTWGGGSGGMSGGMSSGSFGGGSGGSSGAGNSFGGGSTGGGGASGGW